MGLGETVRLGCYEDSLLDEVRPIKFGGVCEVLLSDEADAGAFSFFRRELVASDSRGDGSDEADVTGFVREAS